VEGAAGTRIGQFVVEGILGQGGMGVVYRARQERPERQVALKVVAPDLAADEEYRYRFLREANAAAQIEHHNVVPVYEVGDDAGQLYIAMRLVAGTDLRAVLAAGPLPPERSVGIVRDVAEALDAAHEAGLVHRDVKPANILIGAPREHVFLTDFGVARRFDSDTHTQTGAVVGTVDYMAPEQVRGERVDARTDIYSLGCVLFECVTGEVPFPRENALAKMYAHGSEPPPSARERNPAVPKPLDAVIRRAMAKAPDQRFQTAGELGAAASAALVGTTPTLPRAASGPRRSWWPVFASIAALAALGVVLALVLGGGGKSGDRVVKSSEITLRNGNHMRLELLVPANATSSAPTQAKLRLSVGPPGMLQEVDTEPINWPWTGRSLVTEFQFVPQGKDAASLDLSWYVKPGDKDTSVHYWSLSENAISAN
jgi:serine/threonine protein kinase